MEWYNTFLPGFVILLMLVALGELISNSITMNYILSWTLICSNIEQIKKFSATLISINAALCISLVVFICFFNKLKSLDDELIIYRVLTITICSLVLSLILIISSVVLSILVNPKSLFEEDLKTIPKRCIKCLESTAIFGYIDAGILGSIIFLIIIYFGARFLRDSLSFYRL